MNRGLVVERLAILREAVNAGETTALDPPDRLGARAYRVHARKDPDLERRMIANGFVSIGGTEIDDLSGVDDPKFIRAHLTKTMPVSASHLQNRV